MDTRWKNIVKRLYGFGKENWRYVPGIAVSGIGVFVLGVLIAYRTSYTTKVVLGGGMIGNLCVGFGMTFLLKHYLDQQYQDWGGKEEDEYEKWKRSRSYSFKRLCKAGALACLAAVWYLYDLVYGNGVWGGLSSGWNFNYATGYVMIITVLLQFLLAGKTVGNYWDGKLDYVMEWKDEMIKRRVEEALELERKSLEKVSRSDQLRVDLITNVSHDLKTPITSMVGYIELIKKEELSDIVRDYIDVVSARTEKLKEMINSLFSLAKASSGNIKFQKESFEVNRLIEQIFGDMEDRVKASGLQFVMQLTKEATYIYSDNTYFYRICQNLIENTLKYSAKGTRVFVKTYLKDERADTEVQKERKKREVLPGTEMQEEIVQKKEDLPGAAAKSEMGKRKICIEITNTACYSMDFTKEDIVERFARADQARTSEGNGLGLAIVSTYAKALGGEFDIRIDCDQFKACLEMGV